MPSLSRKPGKWFIIKDQVRKSFAEEDLLALGQSMKERQLQPCGALADGTLLYGERRVRAAILVGIDVDVLIYDGPLTDSQIKVIQITENVHRSDLTDVEIYRASKELLTLNPAWTRKELMAHLHKDASMATRIFSVDELIPPAREAFLGGAFGFSKAYAISKGDHKQQHELLAGILGGASRDAVEQQGRRVRNGKATVTQARVKIALPKAMVVISGNDLGMIEVVECLTDALKETRKAADQFDVKTFQSMMKDKARGTVHGQ